MSTYAIIGLGNPGRSYYYQRHSIGFRVVDRLAELLNGTWHHEKTIEYAKVSYHDHRIILVKPQTFMNTSGTVMPLIKKEGHPDYLIVIHDELELSFGKIKHRFGGSARGHNGLKSIIAAAGDKFHRICIGIDRPKHPSDVPEYVLSPFTQSEASVTALIEEACTTTLRLVESLTTP